MPTIVVASELEWERLTELHGMNHIITGVGMPAVYRSFLKRAINGPLISVGIAGAYPDTGLSVGDVVMVSNEQVGDLGMELTEKPYFKPLREFPFGSSHRSVDLYASTLIGCRVVGGCTVSQVTGTGQTGCLRRDIFAAAIETMEGYAVADIAAANDVRCIEIRAISNIAAERDMRAENIRYALEALQAFWMHCGHEILESLNEA